MKVGDKVVCIAAVAACLRYNEQIPIVGEIYSIREIYEMDGGVWIKLNEIVNVPQDYREGFVECSFNSTYFRPLTFGEQETEKVLEHFSLEEEFERERSPKPKKQTV